MPKSTNLAAYAQEYWDVLDAVRQGRVLRLPLDARAATSMRSSFYAFRAAIAAALKADCKGLPESLAALVREHAPSYAQVAFKIANGQLIIMSTRATAEVNLLRSALQGTAPGSELEWREDGGHGDKNWWSPPVPPNPGEEKGPAEEPFQSGVTPRKYF